MMRAGRLRNRCRVHGAAVGESRPIGQHPSVPVRAALKVHRQPDHAPGDLARSQAHALHDRRAPQSLVDQADELVPHLQQGADFYASLRTSAAAFSWISSDADVCWQNRVRRPVVSR